MSKRPIDHRSTAEWTTIAELVAQGLSAAPPRSLRAVIEMNRASIELRIKRGWSISHLVQELADVGIKTTVPVFKNTLYRIRKKTAGAQTDRGWIPQPPSHGRSGPISPVAPPTPVFKSTADAKKHF